LFYATILTNLLTDDRVGSRWCVDDVESVTVQLMSCVYWPGDGGTDWSLDDL